MESQRPDATIKDEKAVALVTQMSLDFSRVRQNPKHDAIRFIWNLPSRQYDRQAQDFLRRRPNAVAIRPTAQVPTPTIVTQ